MSPTKRRAAERPSRTTAGVPRAGTWQSRTDAPASHGRVRPAPPPPVGAREAAAVADLFRTLADPTRLRILALLGEGEACVHVICARLGMGQSAVSHQLRLLRVGHLVRSRRDGREIYYAMDDEHVAQLIRDGRYHAGCAQDRVGPPPPAPGSRPSRTAERAPGTRPSRTAMRLRRAPEGRR